MSDVASCRARDGAQPGIARAETTFCEMVQGNATVQERSFVTFQTQSGWRAAFVPPPLRHTSKPPEQVAAGAVGEIERSKAAIEALGDSTAHATPLKEDV